MILNSFKEFLLSQRESYKLSKILHIINVSDNGAGIPDGVQENIFIPFFSTKKAGSGIGLSLSKQIMMLHKGNIQVHSVDGEGTTFSLIF